MIAIIFALIGLIILLVLILSFLIPYFFGAPFEPMPKSQIKKLIKFGNIKKTDRVVDLGSGKGDVIIELAKKGINVVGYEINPFLVAYTKFKIKKEKLKNAKVEWSNFWNKNLGNFDVIVLFQIGYIMGKLEKKLKNELKKNARVISYYWKFPKWKYIKKSGKLYLYKKI